MSDDASTMRDIEAIRQLKARYFRCLDTKDWDAFHGVFTADVDIEADGYSYHGPDAFVAAMRTVLDGVTTVHHGHMPEIDLVSATSATGVWAMEDMLRWPNGMEMHGYGHYHETYEKVDGAWRIKSTTLTRLRSDLVQPVVE